MALAACIASQARAADPTSHASTDTHAAPASTPAAQTPAPNSVANQLREALKSGASANMDLTLVISGKKGKHVTAPAQPSSESARTSSKKGTAADATETDHGMAALAAPTLNPKASRQYIRARAAALTGHELPAPSAKAAHDDDAHWSYEGESGPQDWGKLKPDFKTCAIGKRQSPINIDEPNTLQGPAEPLQFNYQPSSGSVVNNGHTIQVDVYGDNSLSVRDSTFKLLQFHFHMPSEERINHRSFSMVAHLVHKNPDGQLAVVSVLLDPGAANALIDKVWTYMPLDVGDRVRMPAGIIDLNELLPKDQRYYQFLGSLTTPPCTEGVLWLVLKQPTTVSAAQIRLFSQIYPHNARPVQAVNGRVVRDMQ